MSLARTPRVLTGAALALGLAAAPVVAQAAFDPLRAKPACVDGKTGKTVKPCPISNLRVTPASPRHGKKFTISFKLAKPGDWTAFYSGGQSGGPLEGKGSMGTAKRAKTVTTTVTDSQKGSQRIGIILTLKNGMSYRYDEHITVR